MQTKTGILLINLGTPDRCKVRSVRRYLREFLSDPRVIDLPAFLRSILLNFFILPSRPKKTAAAYQAIWTKQGSPLLVYSQQLCQLVSELMIDDAVVELGMRYGKPSIEHGLAKLLEQNCEKILLVPLFPQYSSAATGSALEKALNIIGKKWNIPSIQTINDFYADRLFIDSLASSIAPHLQSFQPDMLLMSYHGLPVRHIKKSEQHKFSHCKADADCPAISVANRYCYRAQCYATSKSLAQALNLSNDQYRVSFQSRLGKTAWIKPYTDLLLPELIAQGVKKLAVVCPSFVVDCLETLEEIGIRAREQWLSLGGSELRLIPCLNANPEWAQALTSIIKATVV